ncbi:M23 family metallopeptidase [Candidatus Uhrbacteria bacterium]|nr:M23 family metallopeptidase [Candidatus Uhrbacteria bacterium]
MLKRHIAKFLGRATAPLMVVGLFFARHIGVPVYRVFFSIRRLIQRLVRPAKHRFIYIISNKYAGHVLIVLIVLSVGYVNLQARDVRAETFGQESLLYQLVASDDADVVEVVEAGDLRVTLGTHSSYLSDSVIDARTYIDLDDLEGFTSPEVGQPEDVRPEVPKRSETESYLVQEGDTIGQIAERFGLNISTILWSNSLTFTSTIRPGDTLDILAQDGVLYTVKSGDTLSRIANSYNVEVDTIIKENGLASANALSIGDQLLLIDGEPPTPVSTTRRSASVAKLFTAPSTTSSSGGWVWPTDWRVITQYYGWRHTGLDVDGDYSTFSYAARGGVVIYSGWRNGYGLTVELDHGDGFVTRYAHHSKNYVSYGEVVSTGQALAQTGTTGRSTGTHLHFEIIKNGRFQNPLDYVR